MADVQGGPDPSAESERSQMPAATHAAYTAQLSEAAPASPTNSAPSTSKIDFTKNASIMSSDLPNGHLVQTLSQSQPMSITTSGSSLSSVMEEDPSGPSPYGTRSRNRSGTRPNYSEDLDMDFDFPTSKGEVVSSKRSTPSEYSTGFRAINGTDAGAAPSRSNNLHDANSQSVTGTPTGTERGDSHAPEKKKRKYERANGAKVVPNARNLAKDLIPGTSQFFAANSHTPEPPPAKKRKTGDGHALNAPGPAGGPSSGASATSRKSSMSHVTRHSMHQSCVVSFDRTNYQLSDGKMEADDGTVYGVDDCVYLICEPPGEPYYLARIMEFHQADPDDLSSPVTSLLINWFYRPKDIQRYSTDPRYLYASMQSDESPITSLRGKCVVKHRSEILDLEDFRKQRDTFWFTQLFDRYIHRPYEMIPAASVTNVPDKVKRAIDEKWKFLVVEPARMKELTSAVKLCKRCSGYCAPNDSVDCGVCRNTYHMTCVRPPLMKKPSRGFAWSCGPCSRAQEKRLEQRHTALLPDSAAGGADEAPEEEEEETGMVMDKSETESDELNISVTEAIPSIHVDIARANLWPWRYLGIHCRVEDVLQYDDRSIYPRAISRLGPRYQATVPIWHGHPVELVKPVDTRRRYLKGSSNKKDAKPSKETVAALEAEKQDRARRPKWVQDEPLGYVARGEDYPTSDERNTVHPLFIMPLDPQLADPISKNSDCAITSGDTLVDDYVARVCGLAKDFGLDRDVYPGFRSGQTTTTTRVPGSIVPTNYLDMALQLLAKHAFDPEKALNELHNSHAPKDFGDPELTKEEMKRFEDGVAKHGSELRLVRKHVKSRQHGEIVRTYYSWKKSEKGQEIWSQHGERRHSRKRAEVSWTDIADDEDDSAFDNDKSAARKRRFQCKFCLTRVSRQWRRAPNVAPGAVVLDDPKGSSKDKANQLVVALCQRCAFLWRKYAMRWEDLDEVAKSLGQSGGRAWKRKSDEDVLRELIYANEAAGVPTSATAAAAALSIGVQVTMLQAQEPARKKLKIGQEKEMTPTAPDADNQSRKKEKEKAQPPPPPPRPPTPPIEPQQPRWKQLPCAICRDVDIQGDELLSCKHCRLTVHRRCYAIPEQSNPAKWICDACLNDKHSEMSLDYKCVLCPVNDRKPELVEPPKVTHKKKNERDREKEKLEKKLADDMAARYQRQQLEKGRPPWPREAIRKTVNNNWMHLVCAVWTPEIRFSDAERFEYAEGLSAALTAPSRVDAVCKLCKIIDGGCVSCQQCHDTFHVACAHEAGYLFGFDIIPVKGSRKDMIQVVSLGGETGSMTAAIWCKEHANSIKTIFHSIHELDPETNLNALQTFVRKFKQADRSLTGTARKANLFSGSAKGANNPVLIPVLASRRTSLLMNGNTGAKDLPSTPPLDEANGVSSSRTDSEKHQCVTCSTEVSPQWWQIQPVNGDARHMLLTMSALVNGTGSGNSWQCHRCYTQGRYKVRHEHQPSEKIESPPVVSHQPDYFELTAPRPLPLQLLGSWSANNSQSPLHFYASADITHIEQAQTDLRSAKVTITDQVGRSHVVSGRTFGSIQDLRLIAWRFFVHNIQDSLGYSETRHALLTEEGLKVYDSETLMPAIANILFRGTKEVSWKIIDNVPEAGNQSTRPQSGHGTQQAPSQTPRTNTYPSRPTNFPVPATRPSPAGNGPSLPPLQSGQVHQAGSPLPDFASSTSSRSSPHFSISPAARPAIPAILATGSVSPPRTSVSVRRSTTPREQGVTASGASSSPNLKNLVHQH